jgi:hypothetical protein
LGSDLDKDKVSLDRLEVMEEVLPPETEEVLSSPSLEQVAWAISLPPLCSTVPEVVWLLEVLVFTSHYTCSLWQLPPRSLMTDFKIRRWQYFSVENQFISIK